MTVGKVPFPGTIPMEVYSNIKNRNFKWPETPAVSNEIKQLVDLMLQVNPSNRLGANLESIKLMKTHPFFEGIDFNEVSSSEFTGLRSLVMNSQPNPEKQPKTNGNLDLRRGTTLTGHR